jgi:hypothetical protein
MKEASRVKALSNGEAPAVMDSPAPPPNGLSSRPNSPSRRTSSSLTPRKGIAISASSIGSPVCRVEINQALSNSGRPTRYPGLSCVIALQDRGCGFAPATEEPKSRNGSHGVRSTRRCRGGALHWVRPTGRRSGRCLERQC